MRSAPDGSPHGERDALLAHVFEARQVVDAGAADDAEHGFGHAMSPPRHKCKGPQLSMGPFVKIGFGVGQCASAQTFFLVK